MGIHVHLLRPNDDPSPCCHHAHVQQIRASAGGYPQNTNLRPRRPTQIPPHQTLCHGRLQTILTFQRLHVWFRQEQTHRTLRYTHGTGERR